jgi:hypothetical protein
MGLMASVLGLSVEAPRASANSLLKLLGMAQAQQ